MALQASYKVGGYCVHAGITASAVDQDASYSCMGLISDGSRYPPLLSFPNPCRRSYSDEQSISVSQLVTNGTISACFKQAAYPM